MRRTDMGSVKDILRHRHDGLTIAEIAAATGRSTGAISRLLSAASNAGIDWPLPPGMDRSAFEAALWPPKSSAGCREGRLEPDWDAAAKEMARRRRPREPRVTRLELWEDHCSEARAAGLQAYGRSRFL